MARLDKPSPQQNAIYFFGCFYTVWHLFVDVMLAQVQVPEPHDPDDAVTGPQGCVDVVDVLFLLPQHDCHVKRNPVHVDDNPKHAVEDAQQQRHLKQSVDAREQFHARAVHGPQVADFGGAESRHTELAPAASAGHRGAYPAFPSWTLSFSDQRLNVLVQVSEAQVQRHARQIEELLDHDARDVRQRRKQAD